MTYRIYSAKGNLVGNLELSTIEAIHGNDIESVNHTTRVVTLKNSSPYGK